MAVELPDDMGKLGVIKLKPNEMFHYAGWGISYKLTPEGKQRVANMVFPRKSEAKLWIQERFLTTPGVTAEVIPVKRSLLMDDRGGIKSWTEELTEE